MKITQYTVKRNLEDVLLAFLSSGTTGTVKKNGNI